MGSGRIYYGKFIDCFFNLGFGLFSYYFKDKISNLFLSSKLPIILNYFILIFPLVLIEEYLTCETPFFSCVLVTVPAFYFFFILLYFIQVWKKLSYMQASILFGFVGWFNEFILVGRIFDLGLLHIIVFTILVIPIYSILAIIPSHYIEKTFRK